MSEIRPGTVLPAKRTPVTLRTSDGLRLVGELALPADSDPVATLICLHPLPTQGGMMDSHLLRKAAFRLPALAQLAVLRFNTRGTTSPEGTSEGKFGFGEDERHDVAAAVSYAADAGPPGLWLLGWSFGTELALKWGLDSPIAGAILLSPPLHRAGDADLDRWAASGKPLVALVPEFDDYLRPEEARRRFARVPAAKVVAVDGAKHLWVGEPYVRIALTEIVRRVNPAALVPPTMALPTHFDLLDSSGYEDSRDGSLCRLQRYSWNARVVQFPQRSSSRVCTGHSYGPKMARTRGPVLDNAPGRSHGRWAYAR